MTIVWKDKLLYDVNFVMDYFFLLIHRPHIETRLNLSPVKTSFTKKGSNDIKIVIMQHPAVKNMERNKDLKLVIGDSETLTVKLIIRYQAVILPINIKPYDFVTWNTCDKKIKHQYYVQYTVILRRYEKDLALKTNKNRKKHRMFVYTIFLAIRHGLKNRKSSTRGRW